MLWTLLGVALAGTATLHVGVHRQAGDVYGIAVDGAAGLCVAGPARISCPANGPVRFHWAADDDWVLVGQTVVEPEEIGVAFVLATEGSRSVELAQLAGDVDRDVVQALFAPAPGVPATAPSWGMIQELQRLARSPDPSIRRSVVDAMVPLWRHTASDPFEPEAPEILSPGLITLLANDPDVRVRRRLASRLRELSRPSVAQREEAEDALGKLLNDTRAPVQRAATATLKLSVAEGISGGEEAWIAGMDRVENPGAPGRAAANTLAFLAKSLTPSDRVDPAEALFRIMHVHPERGWTFWYAWRESLPWDRERMHTLLSETVGLHRGLLRHFDKTRHDDLQIALRDWEPHPPHSERWEVVQIWLKASDKATSSAAADPADSLSHPPGAKPAR